MPANGRLDLTRRAKG